MPRGHTRGKHALEPARSATFHTVFRRRRTALVAAPLVTALAVGTGVLTSGFTSPSVPTQASASIGSAASSSAPDGSNDRSPATSRSVDRVPLVDHRVPKATGKLWTTEDLDLRTQPREKARTVGLLDAGKRVPVTGRKVGAYSEVIIGKTARWVTADYLSKEKAPEPGSMGLVDRPCTGVTGSEDGLTDSAVRVFRAVCNNFPDVVSYGGYAARGEHSDGKAIDIMVPDTGTGDRLRDFLFAHQAELDLFDIIWNRTIWTIQRSGEGFRGMEDRGSPTANHEDHVHVKVN